MPHGKGFTTEKPPDYGLLCQKLITRRSEVQVLLPQPSWVTKIDTLTWNLWEIRGFSVFMPCFFKACFIDTQGHLRVSGRIWTQFSADLACFMVGSTLSDTFYCSSFLKIWNFLSKRFQFITGKSFVKILPRANKFRKCFTKIIRSDPGLI